MNDTNFVMSVKQGMRSDELTKGALLDQVEIQPRGLNTPMNNNVDVQSNFNPNFNN